MTAATTTTGRSYRKGCACDAGHAAPQAAVDCYDAQDDAALRVSFDGGLSLPVPAGWDQRDGPAYLDLRGTH